MSYYFFNKCRKDCLPELEILADELKLREMKCRDSVRQWDGYPFKRKEKFDRNLLVIYALKRDYPFMLQTSEPVSHKQTDVKKVVQRFIKICKPTQIYDFGDIPYDMGEFK